MGILSAVRRSKLTKQHVGRKTPATSLSKVLEEVSALYSWDRPALHSPVKIGRKIDQKVGSAVVIVTKVPETPDELEKFLCSKKKPSARELVNSFVSKRVKSQFTGE